MPVRQGEHLKKSGEFIPIHTSHCILQVFLDICDHFVEAVEQKNINIL